MELVEVFPLAEYLVDEIEKARADILAAEINALIERH